MPQSEVAHVQNRMKAEEFGRHFDVVVENDPKPLGHVHEVEGRRVGAVERPVEDESMVLGQLGKGDHSPGNVKKENCYCTSL